MEASEDTPDLTETFEEVPEPPDQTELDGLYPSPAPLPEGSLMVGEDEDEE
jgi:hypothetical protein